MNDDLQDKSLPKTKLDDLSEEELSASINKKISWLHQHYLVPLLTGSRYRDEKPSTELPPHEANEK